MINFQFKKKSTHRVVTIFQFVSLFFQLTLLFSAFYIRYYMSKYDSELSSTLAAIFALSVTLLTSDLVPVDIFLVSYMKNSDGTFKVGK